MITRAPRPTSNFYLLDKAISEDKRLSWAARGLLIFLLGKPDHWTVSPAALVNETAKSARRVGRDGVYAILKELKDAGYLHVIGNRSDGGTFAGADYLVSERPHPDFPDTVDSPYAAEPYTDKPDTANPTQVSIEKKQVLKEKQGLNIPAAPTAPPTLSEVAPVAKQKKAKPDDTQDTELQAACRATWAAYAAAYRTRYGTDPVRNAKVNSNVKDFVKRIGHDEAPGVAAFYVTSISEPFVVRSCHALGTLLQSAEAYRTQWATGRTADAYQHTPLLNKQSALESRNKAVADAWMPPELRNQTKEAY